MDLGLTYSTHEINISLASNLEQNPDQDVLHSFGIDGPLICVFYRHYVESLDHIFVDCHFPSEIINKMVVIYMVELDTCLSFHHLLVQVIKCFFSPRTMSFWKMTWMIFFLAAMEDP